MTPLIKRYCLDANVLIRPWQTYYNPHCCPTYWDLLNDFGSKGIIFIPSDVYDEIVKTDDDLKAWLLKSKIPVKGKTPEITKIVADIFSSNPDHERLVAASKGRSLADPWVIAHAIHEKATVVTKEEKSTAANKNKIKIPDVCDNMRVRYINDFQFIAEMDIKFTCLKPSLSFQSVEVQDLGQTKIISIHRTK